MSDKARFVNADELDSLAPAALLFLDDAARQGTTQAANFGWRDLLCEDFPEVFEQPDREVDIEDEPDPEHAQLEWLKGSRE